LWLVVAWLEELGWRSLARRSAQLGAGGGEREGEEHLAQDARQPQSASGEGGVAVGVDLINTRFDHLSTPSGGGGK